MIRQAPRCLFRAPIPSLRSTPTCRFLSTAPPAQKSRSWKNYATRVGLAVGVIYYYNTSTLFAEEPPFAVPPPNSPSDETSLLTLESVKSIREDKPSLLTPPPESTEPETLEEREQQASQEGAFNEETGEINWDCPCLGGMGHGPCGEQFREAFTCFVFSKAEPKGMDCIENFKTMQNCFREHPNDYGSELEDDNAPPEEGAPSPSPAPLPDSDDGSIPAAATSATSESQLSPSSSSPDASASGAGTNDTERARAAKQQVDSDHGEPLSESDELVPRAAHDATGADTEK